MRSVQKVLESAEIAPSNTGQSSVCHTFVIEITGFKIIMEENLNRLLD